MNKKQCETKGVIYVAGHPLLNRRLQDSPGVSSPKRELNYNTVKVPLNSDRFHLN